MTFWFLQFDGHPGDTPIFHKEEDARAYVTRFYSDAWFGEFEPDRHRPVTVCVVFESETAADNGDEPIAIIECEDDDPQTLAAAEEWATTVPIQLADLPSGEFQRTRRDENVIRHEMSNYNELCRDPRAKYAHPLLRERFDDRIAEAIEEANEGYEAQD